MNHSTAILAAVLAGLLGCHLEQAQRPVPPPDSNRQVRTIPQGERIAPDGARLVGLQTVVYTATNLDSAKAWYQSATGVRPYFDEPFYVGFNIGGFELGITPLEGVRPDPGSAIAYWGVANIDSVWQHLTALGALVHEPIEDVGDGVRLGTVRDPFGNLLGIVENASFRVGW